MEKDYYLGLDLGTSSVGWAVTDTEYHLLRAKGKDLWGVRMFEEAQTSAGRRVNRVSRRRRQRQTARIGFLKEYFADAITKVDPCFYERMEQSRYHQEDKSLDGKNSVFADKNYTDKDYYREYPTIFHLRMELISNKQSHDVRLVYLALLNMFKHRGHFLNAGLSIQNQEQNIAELYSAIAELGEQLAEPLHFPESFDMGELEIILSTKGISRTVMAERIAELLGISKSKNKREYEVVKGICGLKLSPSVIFSLEKGEAEKVGPFSFRESSYEEGMEKSASVLEEQEIEFLEAMKQLHDAGLLSNVMKGYRYLSESRVADYEKHKEDLRILKKVIRESASDKYDDLFRELNSGSYSAYVNSTNSDGVERRNIKGRTKDDLYNNLKKILKEIPDSESKSYILGEIDSESFLPRQLTSANGVIPNQVHAVEMKAILDNAERYLPFLLEKDASGLTVSERILQLFQFQIPYYVGPIGMQHKGRKEGHAWAVRKSGEKVMPWNIDEVIDMNQTRQEFIERMVRHCTYINGERAIPKDSLLYERYRVLNELNTLKVRGERISVDLKQAICCDLFEKGKRVTRKQLNEYLIAQGVIEIGETDAISGIDGDFKNSLSSYGKFAAILGAENMKRDDVRNMVETIIFNGTIYKDDKRFLRDFMKREYGDKLSDAQIQRISGFKYYDWGNLSRAFLELTGCDKETGEVLPLISMMWERNANLMELLSDKYTYMDSLQEKTESAELVLNKMEYEDLDELGLSSPVKRMLWQTILVMKEVEGVLGHEPSRIFVEMPREHGEQGKRTDSRKKKLKELYKGCKIDGRNWGKELERYSDEELRGKKLYLYYLQQGRCMYSGEPIDIEQLFNDNLYDIDHIYPRHFVKDDSLENNLVLVKKELNAHKKDHYPIEHSIRQQQKAWWRSLLTEDGKSKFITREKYDRLVCAEELSDEQLVGFISRQLVETRQGTKAVAHLLEEMHPDAEVVYVKAGNVSEFRREYGFLKCRAVNDFHHAQDAYLNIVVGNVYHVKFTKNPMNFVNEYRKNPGKNAYHMDKMFQFPVVRKGEVAWRVDNVDGEAGSIVTVRKMMSKNSPLVTRMTFEQHGQIAEATLYGAKVAKKDSYIPLKEKDERLQDVTKYGGFGSVSIAYFFLVEHEVKGKRIRTIESLPLYLKSQLENNRDTLVEYCEKELKLSKPDIRVSRINKQSLIKRNGFFMYISGKSNARLFVNNAVSLCANQEAATYVKKLEKMVETSYLDTVISKDKNLETYDFLVKKHKETVYAKRPNPIGSKLENGRNAFLKLDIMAQGKVLLQILQISQLSNMGADLSLIGESKKTGVSMIGKTVSDVDEFLLINLSPAGLYVSVTDLKTV